jgi:hypothetical protein
MTARRLPLVVLLLACGVAAAQTGPTTDVKPDELRRLAARLKKLDPGTSPSLDPKQVERQLEAFKKQYPGLSNEELAEKLAEQFGLPSPSDPGFAETMKKLMEGAGKQDLPGLSPGGKNPLDGPKPPTPPVGKFDPPKLPPGDPPLPKTFPKRNKAPFDPAPSAAPAAPSPRPAGRPMAADEMARRTEAYNDVRNWWESRFGPLKNSPAVQDLMKEMIAGRDKAGAPTGGSLDEVVQSLAKSAKAAGGGKGGDGGGWKLPGFGGGGLSSGGPVGGPVGGGAFAGGSWLPVILFVVVAAVGLGLLWLWPRLMGKKQDGPTPVPGLGPWPLDPRTIRDRDDLVRAFEYLSVLVNGADARTWNHRTIAGGFRKNVAGAADSADELADAYCVARYTPPDRPMSDFEVETARTHLCRLARVSPP